MSVKQKINIFEKMYVILVILVEIFHDFGRFFATRIRNTDPNHRTIELKEVDLKRILRC